MNPLRIFTLAALVLVVFGMNNVEAEKEPLWNYTIEDGMNSVAISADGEYIGVSGSSNFYLFNKDTNIPLWNFDLGNNYGPNVAISIDGKYIAIGGHGVNYTANLYFFNKDSNVPIWNYTTNLSWGVSSLAISANGEYIAAGFGGYTSQLGAKICLFHKDNSTPLWAYDIGGGSGVDSLSISENGTYFVASRSPQYDDVYLFHKDNSTPLWTLGSSIDFEGVKLAVAISADGEYIALRSEYSLWLFNKNNEIPLWRNEGDIWGGGLPKISISADGEYMVIGSPDCNIYLFHKDSNAPLRNYTVAEIYDYCEMSIAISADSNYITAVSNNENSELFLFGKENRTVLWSYVMGDYSSKVDISDDGNYIVTSSNDYDTNDFKVYLFNKTEPIFVEETSDTNVTNNEESLETPCQTGDSKIADDGCNQCVCNDGNWVCTETDCAVSEDEEGLLPSLSLHTSLISIGLIARYRRK